VLFRSSSILSLCFISAIIIGVFSFIAATSPEFMYTPSTCEKSVRGCDNDPVLCPDSMICPPVPHELMDDIDKYILYIFTADLIIRVGLVWCVPCKLAGIHAKQALYLPPWQQVLRYLVKPMVLIDLATVLPYWIVTYSESSGGSKSTTFVRVLRLIRLLRVLARERSSGMLDILERTITKVFFFFYSDRVAFFSYTYTTTSCLTFFFPLLFFTFTFSFSKFLTHSLCP